MAEAAGARPNILIVMVDQLNGTFFPDGPAPFLRVPHLNNLAARAARFRTCYTASPLCAPARAAFMSGMLPSRTGVYDNAAEFASSIPTFAHHLRAAGYRTCLSGKMHFVGPDQLHGFEERLTTDIYPADFGWTPDYRKPGERIDWWYHNLGSVAGAGTAETTNQLEYDDEVGFLACQKLYEFSRDKDSSGHRPWCLTVSFTHPHDPYVARRRHWDLYWDCPALAPDMAAIPYEEQDPHSRRLLEASDHVSFALTEENVRRARRGYFASLSYIDDHLGALMSVLERTEQAEETVVLFCSDHGDMLGERGLWFKMSFLEGSSRVPLMLAGPGIPAGLIEEPVSNLDVLPTLCALAGVDLAAIEPWTEGRSLLPLTQGARRVEPVLMEYAAEGSQAPMAAVRGGRFKFCFCPIDPPQLFDLESDPLERVNLAADRAHADLAARFTDYVKGRWDWEKFDRDVRESQARRWIVYPALRNGAYYPWDFQPLRQASERFMRNHMDLNVLEESKRFPRGG